MPTPLCTMEIPALRGPCRDLQSAPQPGGVVLERQVLLFFVQRKRARTVGAFFLREWGIPRGVKLPSEAGRLVEPRTLISRSCHAGDYQRRRAEAAETKMAQLSTAPQEITINVILNPSFFFSAADAIRFSVDQSQADAIDSK